MWYYDFFCWFGMHLGRKWTKVREVALVDGYGEKYVGRRYYYEAVCSHCGHTKNKRVDV